MKWDRVTPGTAVVLEMGLSLTQKNKLPGHGLVFCSVVTALPESPTGVGPRMELAMKLVQWQPLPLPVVCH